MPVPLTHSRVAGERQTEPREKGKEAASPGTLLSTPHSAKGFVGHQLRRREREMPNDAEGTGMHRQSDCVSRCHPSVNLDCVNTRTSRSPDPMDERSAHQSGFGGSECRPAEQTEKEAALERTSERVCSLASCDQCSSHVPPTSNSCNGNTYQAREALQSCRHERSVVPRALRP